jgi:hypothetical protein
MDGRYLIDKRRRIKAKKYYKICSLKSIKPSESITNPDVTSPANSEYSPNDL